MKMYQVGGYVRDEILGHKSNDIDFTVVLDDNDLFMPVNGIELSPFNAMIYHLNTMGFKIFLETPEYLTVRAQFPERYFTVSSLSRGALPVLKRETGLTADFVLARKESKYTDGRRPDVVQPGTLLDDLARRDFCVNAIAKDADGSYIDPFNGREDLAAGILRAVGDPVERLTEDALRAVRALRFSVTKGFKIESDLGFAMQMVAVLDAIENKISDERIDMELRKMFSFSTLDSLAALNKFPALTAAMFSDRVSLISTMKQKGRNK